MKKAQEAVDAARVRIARLPEIANRENIEEQLRYAQIVIDCAGGYTEEQKECFREEVFRAVADVKTAADTLETAVHTALGNAAGNPPKRVTKRIGY